MPASPSRRASTPTSSACISATAQEVKQGDLLFTLDGRAIEAQIAQTEGAIARDQAQLDGAERDVDPLHRSGRQERRRPTVNLDNAKTQAEVYRAAIKADQGLLDNLKVQLSYCTITAPITGRISAAAVKVGNFVRQADTTPMATINQMAPVYVSFTVPQKRLRRHPRGARQRNRDHRGHRAGHRQAHRAARSP